MKKPLIIYVTKGGKELAERLTALLGGGEYVPYREAKIEKAFSEKQPLIFIGACGIAVRAICPHLKHKSEDPPVLVLDERGRFVISLLSGHLGGANALAEKVAELLKATPVITTASEVKGLPALDLWLKEQGALLENWDILKKLQGKLVNEGALSVFLEPPLALPLPAPLKKAPSSQKADFIITYKEGHHSKPFFFIKALCLGVGFHDKEKELCRKVIALLKEKGLSPRAVKYVATLDKRGKNPSFSKLAATLSAESKIFTGEDLSRVFPPSPSHAQKALKIPGVAEPCALLAAEGGPLVLPKTTYEGITVAVAVHAAFTFR